MMVEHDSNSATRFQHSKGLSYAPLRIWAVVQHTIRVHDVEGICGEGKILGVGLEYICLVPGGLTPRARLLDSSCRQVNTCSNRSRFQPLEVIRAHANSHLQNFKV